LVADYRRRAAFTREDLSVRPDSADATISGPDEDLATARQRALVLKALDALNAEQRAVLVAHDLDATPIPDLVAALKPPPQHPLLAASPRTPTF